MVSIVERSATEEDWVDVLETGWRRRMPLAKVRGFEFGLPLNVMSRDIVDI
jgi:hypothetical protein